MWLLSIGHTLWAMQCTQKVAYFILFNPHNIPIASITAILQNRKTEV